MEEDIEKYKKDCDLLELTDDELISEAKATLIDAMDRKSDGFRRPEKVALVAIEKLIARYKELEEKVKILSNHNYYIEKSKIEEEFERMIAHNNCFNVGDLNDLLDRILN